MPALGDTPLLRPGWIVYALFALNPLFWLMGLGGLIWSMAALPLVVWVLLRRDLARPPTVAMFALYVAWSAVSVIRVDRVTRLLSFGLRYAVFISALCLAYYVYNEQRVSRAKFIDWVAMFWIWAIIGGYLGLLFPYVRISVTPASLLLPGSFDDNEFIGNLVRPRFAQVQNVFGVPIPRPSALFRFTNEWGANVGLLTPFFVAATLYSHDLRRRRAGVIGLLIALPPMILSVNRGLWLSVGAIIGLVAVRSFLAGRTAPLKLLAGGILVVSALLIATPIGDVVVGRLSESDAGARAGIYAEAWEGAKQSPVLGWGSPRPSANPFSPAVGTHGHFWYTMFSHGLVALGLCIAWLTWTMYRVVHRHDPVSILLASVVFVGALQMFFYNAFPSPLPIILIAVGLLYRDDHPNAAIESRPISFAATPTRPLATPLRPLRST